MAKTTRAERSEPEMKCAGCGKEFGERASYGYQYVETYVGKEEKVYVCTGRYHDLYRKARKSCVQAARERAARCPGCDKERVQPGTICEACQEKIALVENTPDVAGRAFYDFDTERFFGDFAWRGDEPREIEPLTRKLKEEARELMRLLARGAALGAYKEEGHRRGGRSRVVPERSEKAQRTDYLEMPDYEDPAAELLPRQAEALSEFGKRLKPYFDHVYALGKSTGHSFLVRLATGDMTREQFEELDEKVEKEKRGEAAEEDEP